MTDNRATYLKAAGLTPELTGEADSNEAAQATPKDFWKAREAALSRSHEIRQFEIDLYWKRANYFWLLQAAVFAAVGLTWRSTASGMPPTVPVLLSALGVVTAWAGYLSALGSKFWQENWEHHIDMLEDEFEGRLHKTAYVGPRGIQWSVSGINERLSLCFFLFWLLVLFVATENANPDWNLSLCDLDVRSIDGTEAGTVVSWVGALFGVLFLYQRPSGMRGSRVDYPEPGRGERLQEGAPRFAARKGSKPYLAKREPRI